MTEDELRAWAEARRDSTDAVALAVLRLFMSVDYARNPLRVPVQVLDRAPEVETPVQPLPNTALHGGRNPFDGSTGLPDHQTAGWKSPEPPGAGQ